MGLKLLLVDIRGRGHVSLPVDPLLKDTIRPLHNNSALNQIYLNIKHIEQSPHHDSPHSVRSAAADSSDLELSGDGVTEFDVGARVQELARVDVLEPGRVVRLKCC